MNKLYELKFINPENNAIYAIHGHCKAIADIFDIHETQNHEFYRLYHELKDQLW